MPKIYPYSQTWNQLAALDCSPWESFLLKEIPTLLEDAYVLAEEMLISARIRPADHLKKMTILLKRQVQKSIEQKMKQTGVV